MIVYITLLSLVASCIGTVSGFGTSTIMVPTLLFFLPLPEVLFLVGIIHWFTNVWKIMLFGKRIRWDLVGGFCIAGVVASFIGASLVMRVNLHIFPQLLGAFFIAYVIFLFTKPSFQVESTMKTAMLGGMLSGFFAGLFGIGGAIRGAFLSAFNPPKRVYIVTGATIALIIDTVRIIGYWYGGQSLAPHLAWGMLFFIPASFAGAQLGRYILGKIPQEKFRTVVALFLLLVGIRLLLLA